MSPARITRTEKRKNLARKPEASQYRSSRERTSSGQAQALWTFVVGVAVAVFAILHLNQPNRLISSEATQAQSDSQIELSIPNGNWGSLLSQDLLNEASRSPQSQHSVDAFYASEYNSQAGRQPQSWKLIRR